MTTGGPATADGWRRNREAGRTLESSQGRTMNRFRTALRIGLLVGVLVAAPTPTEAQSSSQPGYCPNGRSKTAATWLSVAHPGLGEYYLKGWGSFGRNCPQRKFWLGFIPIYGWPGYLQIRSAIDANHCRTDDRI